MKFKYYAPYNKTILEVDVTIYGSFIDVVYDEYQGFKLIGTASCVNQKCFQIVQESRIIMYNNNAFVRYQLVNSYRSFRSANRRFQELKNVYFMGK